MKERELYTDEELVLRLQGGDKSIYALVYQRYFKMLFRYLEKSIGSKEDCEEIIQDTFVALLTRKQGEPIKSLKEYLFASVRFGMLRFFRKRQMNKRYADHFLLFAEIYESQGEEGDLLIEHIKGMIHPLPPRSQTAFILRLDNLSNEEIAKRLNISKRTVEWHIYRVVSFLRDNKSAVASKLEQG